MPTSLSVSILIAAAVSASAVERFSESEPRLMTGRKLSECTSVCGSNCQSAADASKPECAACNACHNSGGSAAAGGAPSGPPNPPSPPGPPSIPFNACSSCTVTSGTTILDGIVGGIVGGETCWCDPPSYMTWCHKVTTVFGVGVCVTSLAWASGVAKVNHVVHVVYQLLDNDADGTVDDASVVNHMIAQNFFMWVPAAGGEPGESDLMTAILGAGFSNGKSQTTTIEEAHPNSCDVPSNRGANDTDRSTWAAAVDTSSLTCSSSRDATVEEVFHLITDAAAVVYPSKWASTWTSEAGVAMSAANGNCGNGVTGDYIDPSTTACTGYYAYNDTSCNVACLMTEGIYWAAVTYIGGLYTNGRADDPADGEWMMVAPDTGMLALPTSAAKKTTLQEGAPALYALISDTTSSEHAWLPAIMPNGVYAVTTPTTSPSAPPPHSTSPSTSPSLTPPPTPPSAPPPPPAPPPLSAEAIVYTMTASGSVGDYADTTALQSTFASLAGVDPSLVSISVAAASVLITTTIAVPTSTSAAAVQASLTSSVGTASDASTALGITVLSAPTIAVVAPPPYAPPTPPPPSPPPPGAPPPDSGSSGLPLGAIIGIAVGGAVGLVLCVLVLVAVFKMKKKKKGVTPS